MTEGNIETHLRAGEIAGYVDGTLGAAARAEVERHLADCAECRADAVAAVTAARPVGRRWLVATPALAAAAAVVFWVAGRQDADDRDRVRAPAAEVLGVVGAEQGPAGAVHLTWRSVGAEAVYAVTFLSDAGDRVWTANTADTTVTLPDSVHLVRSDVYHWFVEAQLRDGGRLTSGPQRLVLGPP